MSSPTWTVRSSLDWTQQYLATKSIENPRLAAQWLLAAATGLSRLELYTNYDLPLDPAQLATLREGIKRRLAGEPLQYILGKTGFRHLELQLRPGVLIPRPETELLVQLVLDWLAAEFGDGEQTGSGETGSRPARVLDLCTGTGCVALSLLQERPGLQVVATDIDAAAVELAAENAALLKLDGPQYSLEFIQDDLATSLLSDSSKLNSFDVIVSNPPYIPTAELCKLSDEIANYEPMLALDGGEDGLSVYKRILQQAKQLLRPSGLLACELHESALVQAQVMADEQGFVSPQVTDDLAGRPRIISMRAAR